ncbi:TraU family protein, partial [Xanthomonas euvesicatoria]
MGINLGPADGASNYGESGVGNMLPDIFGSGNSRRIPNGTAAPICLCPGRSGYPAIGITWGYWEPSHLTEVVRKPYCAPLFGTTLLKDSAKGMPGGQDVTAGQTAMKMIRWGGPNKASDATSENLGQTFYHYHWLKSPYGYVSDWIQSALCSSGSGGDMDYL